MTCRFFSHCWTVAIALLVAGGCQSSVAQSGPALVAPLANADVGEVTEVTAGATPANLDADINRLITRMALANMPHTYVNDKNWGKTDRRFDGIRLRREGARIETKRKWKTVNHGTWKQYSAQLVEPDRSFQIEIKKIRAAPDNEVAFQLCVATPLQLHGRQAKWVKGVQFYSISADATASIRMVVDFRMGVKFDSDSFPPDILFAPRAVAARLHVDDFRVQRVSKLGGEVAQQVTRGVRTLLDEEIEEKEKKLVEKINRGIEKNGNRLRISLSAAAKSKWADRAREHLPDELRRSVENHFNQSNQSR